MLVADNSGEVMELYPYDNHQLCYKERMGLWQVALIVQCHFPIAGLHKMAEASGQAAYLGAPAQSGGWACPRQKNFH